MFSKWDPRGILVESFELLSEAENITTLCLVGKK